jgi:hypothetical protein
MKDSSPDARWIGLEVVISVKVVLAGVCFRLVWFCAGCLAWFLDAIPIFYFHCRVWF